jgi:outer membrane protein insertion porin family
LKHRFWVLATLLCLTTMSWAQATGVISEIVISGNKNITKEAIETTMRTKVGQPYVQAQLDQDKEALEKLGFFKAVDIRARELDGSNWSVTVEISEYPMVKEIRIIGNDSVPTAEILKVLAIGPGKVFNLNSVATSTAAIRKLYTDKGFFVAGFEQFGPSDEAPETIQITIVELTVNSVAVEGNVKTRDKIMKRLIKTRPGDAFNARKWEKDIVRVHNTQWFEDVKSKETMSEEGTGKLDLGLSVKEARTGQFNVGLQVDPRSGFAGFVRVMESNFRGTGQDVGLTYLQATSGDGASVDLSYANPFYDRRDTALNVQLYSRLMYRFSGTTFGNSSPGSNFDTYNERRTGGSVAFTRPFHGGDYFGTIGARFEDIVTGKLDTSLSTNFIQQDGRLAVLTFGTTMNRRDVDMDPSRGDWMQIKFEPGYSDITKVGGLFPDPSLVGASYFFRGTGEYRRYWSAGPARGRNLDAPRKVLAFRVKYGAISGTVPFYEQFFAGGSDTVRGYDEDRYWGKYTLISTLEYRYPIQKAFNAIAFVDYGGAWGGYGSINTYSQSNSFNMHVGYGIGFSFRTPFGPIRLDFGFGEDGKSRTHFLIGTSF